MLDHPANQEAQDHRDQMDSLDLRDNQEVLEHPDNRVRWDHLDQQVESPQKHNERERRRRVPIFCFVRRRK